MRSALEKRTAMALPVVEGKEMSEGSYHGNNSGVKTVRSSGLGDRSVQAQEKTIFAAPREIVDVERPSAVPGWVTEDASQP